MVYGNTPLANPMIVLREESDNWALLFNPDTSEIVVINPVGVTVWKMLDGKNRYDDILEKLKDCFSEVPDSAMPDIEAFVADLEMQGFVGFVVDN